MHSVVQDFRHTLRVFRRAPLFFAGATLTLALGIGANGAVFSILRAVLLQPLPYRDPGRVVMVWRTPEHPPAAPSGMLQNQARRRALTGDMAFGWRDESRDVLDNFAALLTWQGNLETQFDLLLSDRVERLRGALATANFFDVLGVSAAEGRVFTAADERANEPMLVLSHGLWQRAFGGDPSIIGRTLTLIVGRPRMPRTFTVIGVLPPAFRFTYPDETELWSIEPWSAVQRYGRGIGFQALARLQPRVTLEAANIRVARIRTGLDFPNARPEYRDFVRVEPITEWVVGDSRPSLLLLSGVALLLLLITCATVANALFVRVTERQRELAVRASLGADPRRLVRQLFTEGVVLAAAGAALGTLLAVTLAPVLRAIVPTTVPRATDIGLNVWMLVFAAVTASIATILAALAPAWRGARFDLLSSLKRASGAVSADRSTSRWRRVLVGFQAAVATALLIGAGLLLTSFWRLGHVPLGFDGEKVLTVEMRLLDAKYFSHRDATGADVPSTALPAFQRELISRIRALPGVLEAGLTSAVPFRGVDFVFVLNRVGETKGYGGNGRFVDPAYFSVLHIGLVRGRLLSDADSETSPRVIVISESYARQMFGAADPIGQVIAGDHPLTVVGVVRDVRYAGLDREPMPAIYLPRAQSPSELICLVARTAPNAGNLGPAIRQAVRAIDPTLPVMNLTTIDRIISESVADRRFYTTATTAFAIVALVLTMVGLVVIVARSVVERRRELAIRAALGATASRLVGLVVTQGLAPVLAGTALGVVGAYAGATALDRFMFHIASREPLVYGGVALILVTTAAVASLAPARQVTDIAPASLLRAE